MERHIQILLNRISIATSTIATIILVSLFIQTPKTCIQPQTPLSKPHFKFPSSTCDSSLRHHHHFILPAKKNFRLWASTAWQKQLSSYTHFFSRLNLLHNESRVLCVSVGAGNPVMALKNMGIEDVAGVEVVDSLPLVSRADPHNLPFFDDVFDFAFTAHLDDALYPRWYAAEMERTIRKGGAVVVVVDECGDDQVKEIVGLFKKSSFVGAMKINLIGIRMMRIIMRTK